MTLLRLVTEAIRVTNIISSVSFIVVCAFIEKEVLNELNSTKMEMPMCKYRMSLNPLNPSSKFELNHVKILMESKLNHCVILFDFSSKFCTFHKFFILWKKSYQFLLCRTVKNPWVLELHDQFSKSSTVAYKRVVCKKILYKISWKFTHCSVYNFCLESPE